MKPNNPFLITGYHSPEYFCDRTQETEAMTNALYNGRNITLVAPRRMGKTGLIKNVFYKLKKQKSEIVTLYMDIFPTQSTADFIRLFANTVLGSLDTAPQKAMSRISKFVKSCRPVFTVDPITGVPKVTIDITADNEQASLREIFDYLGSSEKRCYIAIDEFQQITEYPEKGLEASLRSFIQFLPNVSFIFSGSKQHVMQDMFLSAKRPFYQSTQIISIDRITREEYERFAAGFFKKQGFRLDSETFGYIYESFGGHTWYIQAILNRLYAYNRQPDRNAVNKAVAEIVEESTYAYEHLLTAYSGTNVKLLKAIAKSQPVKEITSGQFIADNSLKAASSVNTALKKLMGNELVYKSPEGYIIYDRFMAIWLRQQPY